jgi:hypothetical protein
MHTKGNWKVDGKHIYSEENDEYDIAELFGPKEEQNANGFLMSAAPDLLSALQALMEHSKDYDNDIVVQAMRAICKAKGVNL